MDLTRLEEGGVALRRRKVLLEEWAKTELKWHL
jgi:hypothetical protein